jgi:hypothetical protein
MAPNVGLNLDWEANNDRTSMSVVTSAATCCVRVTIVDRLM